MAKAVADTDSPTNQGGFAYDGSNITGFSGLHDSGTGGSPSLGNFPLFPYVKCDGDDINGCVYPKKDRKTGYDPNSVTASPGYFGLTMNSGIMVDMTASHHTSLFRFRFPNESDASSPLILLDLTDLSDSRQDNGTISVDPSTGRMMGHARFLPSFGSGSYVPYFCADFQSEAGLRDNGIFVNSRASTEVKKLNISRSINGYPLPVCNLSLLYIYLLAHSIRAALSSDSTTHPTKQSKPASEPVSSAASKHAKMLRLRSRISTSPEHIQSLWACGRRRWLPLGYRGRESIRLF